MVAGRGESRMRNLSRFNVKNNTCDTFVGVRPMTPTSLLSQSRASRCLAAGWIQAATGKSGGLGRPLTKRSGGASKNAERTFRRSSWSCSARPWCTASGVIRPMPEWRCSVLYQQKKPRHNSRACLHGTETLRESGTILESFELALGVGIVVGDVRARVGFGHAEIREQHGDSLRFHSKGTGHPYLSLGKSKSHF